LIEEGAFLEYAQFGGNYYGTSAKAVEDVSKPNADASRRRALLDIDTQVSFVENCQYEWIDDVLILPSNRSITRESN
jgi:guanylate kinase